MGLFQNRNNTPMADPFGPAPAPRRAAEEDPVVGFMLDGERYCSHHCMAKTSEEIQEYDEIITESQVYRLALRCARCEGFIGPTRVYGGDADAGMLCLGCGDQQGHNDTCKYNPEYNAEEADLSITGLLEYIRAHDAIDEEWLYLSVLDAMSPDHLKEQTRACAYDAEAATGSAFYYIEQAQALRDQGQFHLLDYLVARYGANHIRLALQAAS